MRRSMRWIAILLAGSLNYFGKKYPLLTGEGRLQPGEHGEMTPAQEEIPGHMDISERVPEKLF